jgi:hypothetical protein
MRRLPFIAVVATVVAMPLHVSLADEGSNSQRQNNTQQRNKAPRQHDDRQAGRYQQRANQMGRRGVSTRGEILRLKKVEIKGRDQAHLVALLRTRRDRRGIVDLGPVEQLEDLQLRQGDRIEVRGQPIKVKDRGVLMAEAVRKSERRTGVERSQRATRVARRAVRRTDLRRNQTETQPTEKTEERTQSRRSQRDSRMRLTRGHLEGKVIRTKQVDVRGTPGKHLVVLLETDRGNRMPIDLGPTANLKEARLSSGDRLMVKGFLVNVGDKRTVIAEEVAVMGQKSAPRRSPDERKQVRRQRASKQR